jgi:hypothetical protein
LCDLEIRHSLFFINDDPLTWKVRNPHFSETKMNNKNQNVMGGAMSNLKLGQEFQETKMEKTTKILCFGWSIRRSRLCSETFSVSKTASPRLSQVRPWGWSHQRDCRFWFVSVISLSQGQGPYTHSAWWAEWPLLFQ